MLKKKNIVLKEIKDFKVLGKFIPENPFICFHNRDSEYLKIIGSDNNDHDFRDYDFKDYKLSINYLLKNKIQPVRIGRIAKDKKKLKGLFYHDYTNKNSNDTNDLYLIENCKFLVASSTGLANIASILRKKTLFVNFIPFYLREMYQYTPGSFFIPKKLYDLKKKRYLKFFEIENLQYDIHEKDFFKKRHIKVINNTNYEIFLAVKEMLKNCSMKNVEIYNSKLHNNFWSSLKDKKAANIIRKKLKFNICDSFLKQNQELI